MYTTLLEALRGCMLGSRDKGIYGRERSTWLFVDECATRTVEGQYP